MRRRCWFVISSISHPRLTTKIRISPQSTPRGTGKKTPQSKSEAQASDCEIPLCSSVSSVVKKAFADDYNQRLIGGSDASNSRDICRPLQEKGVCQPCDGDAGWQPSGDTSVG